MDNKLVKAIIGIAAAAGVILLSTGSEINSIGTSKKDVNAIGTGDYIPGIIMNAIPGVHIVNPILPCKWEPGKTLNGDIKAFIDDVGNNNVYSRVTINAYFTNSNNEKIFVNPSDYVDIHYVNIDDTNYYEDTSASTDERRVFYYLKSAEPLTYLPTIIDSIHFREDVDINAICNPTFVNGEYNGNCQTEEFIFHLEVQYDVIQTAHTDAAMYSAWGVHICEATNNLHESC